MSSPLTQADPPAPGHGARVGSSQELQANVVQLEQAAALFTRVRPRLFGIACRIVGNATDAEDIVQDVWLRWHTYDRGPVSAPAAFLATTATRLAINAIQSARARHETYVDTHYSGKYDSGLEPALEAEEREALHSAFLLLLEALSPAERAAYVLREAFEYPYQDIAELIHATEAATRQLVSRARKCLVSERRKPVESPESERLLTAFLAAAQTGDFTVLEHLLAQDVISHANKGRIYSAPRVIDRARVVKLRGHIAEQSGPASAA